MLHFKSLTRPEKWILIGIPLLFGIGSLMHFLYDLLWENPVIGCIAPVNESIWEHSKLALWPVILWWVVYFCFRRNLDAIDSKKWFGSALVALLTSLLSMPLLYYFYNGAFGVELLWVDILIFFLAIFFGQLLGLHFYRHSKGINAVIVSILFLAIVVFFIVVTFFPPHIPLFQDGISGTYGIQ